MLKHKECIKYTINIFKEIQKLSNNKYKIINDRAIYFDTDVVKIIFLKFNDYHNIALCYYSTIIDDKVHVSVCLKKIILYRSYKSENIEFIQPHVTCLWIRNIKHISEIKKFIYDESTLNSIAQLL